jgi:hypothetical protein
MIKKIIPFILVAVIVGGGAFFWGMKYGESKKSFGKNYLGSGNMQGGPQMSGTPRNGNGQNGGFVNGSIISKDETSITVKLINGGSKIVFFADSTEFSKFASGASSDLEVGKSVTVTGKTNSDGSVTAQSIQIRPEVPTGSPQSTTK